MAQTARHRNNKKASAAQVGRVGAYLSLPDKCEYPQQHSAAMFACAERKPESLPPEQAPRDAGSSHGVSRFAGLAIQMHAQISSVTHYLSIATNTQSTLGIAYAFSTLGT